MQENKINERIARYRSLAGLTQIELAARLGIKPTTYSQRERTGNFSAEDVVKIADILGISVLYLLYDETDQQEPAQSFYSKSQGVLKQPFINPLFPNDAPTMNVEEYTAEEKRYIRLVRNMPKAARKEICIAIDDIYHKYKRNRG